MFKNLIALILVLPMMAHAAAFTEGKDYTTVSNPMAVSKSKAPAVTEFFSYGCPWCYKMEPEFNQWVAGMGKGIEVERVPVVFKPEWDLYAKAFYTAKVLALSGKISPALFRAIQEEHKPLATKQAMIDFFVSKGVDREIAKSAFESSPSIDMQVKNGMMLMANYQINAVPAFVINHKYKTDLQMAGSPERLFEIMTFLLKK